MPIYNEVLKTSSPKVFKKEVETITTTELYKLSNKPKFLRQTPANDDGDFSMFWEINNKTYKTNSNLFN